MQPGLLWRDLAPSVQTQQSLVSRGLTFELRRPAEADAGWPRRDDIHRGP
jgi:hypothetical protein